MHLLHFFLLSLLSVFSSLDIRYSIEMISSRFRQLHNNNIRQLHNKLHVGFLKRNNITRILSNRLHLRTDNRHWRLDLCRNKTKAMLCNIKPMHDVNFYLNQWLLGYFRRDYIWWAIKNRGVITNEWYKRSSLLLLTPIKAK